MSEFEFLPPVGSKSKNSTSPAPETNNVGAGEEGLNFEFLPPAPPKNDTSPSSRNKTAHDLIGVGGAMAGAYTTNKILPASGGFDSGVLNPNTAMDRASLERYLRSQLSPNLKMNIGDLENVLGGQKIRTMSEVQNALKAIQEVKAERVGKTTSIDAATGQPRKIYTMEPGRPAMDLSEFERKPGFINRATDQLSDLADMAKGKLKSVGRVGVGGLGGALAGAQLYDAVDQYQKEGPSLRNAARFASGVGGALSAVPTGFTQAAGVALQAPELGYQAVDYGKELEKRRQQATREDVDKMLTNVDMMGNPIP